MSKRIVQNNGLYYLRDGNKNIESLGKQKHILCHWLIP